uniref:LAGLIDADG homing endonuclease n=1 Tax=Endoconidiophora resinifera TaxID=1580851 RepID=A0A3S8V269_9PEZI|nr:LAGLIDADG homing endonuclease [Endoconidiophora resinifera]
MLILFSVFDKFNLNTTKYLDYLNLKKAFFTYQSKKESHLTPKELTDSILDLKGTMNTKRVQTDMPVDHKLTITKDWLLGYIEGDGSFSLERKYLNAIFSLAGTGEQLLLFNKIKEFLVNELFKDKYSLFKLGLGKAILIIKGKIGIDLEVSESVNHKSSLALRINNLKILNNYLIPYLDSMTFMTKKGLDYQDFKLICMAIYKGAEASEYIKELILKLSYTMNNYRLSTYDGKVELISESERNLIANATPFKEYLSDGRVKNLISNEITSNPNSCIYEVITPDKGVLLVETLGEVISLVKGKSNMKLAGDQLEVNGYLIKRQPIFSNEIRMERV